MVGKLFKNTFEEFSKKYEQLSEGKNPNFTFSKIHKDPKSFYNDPQMMGHRWGIETLDALELVSNKFNKTKFQKFILKYAVSFDIKSDDDAWHYFNNWSKRDIKNLQKMLKGVGKDSKNMTNHLMTLNADSPMLKTPLTHTMEWLAYKYDEENFEKYYARNLGAYGMSSEDTLKRLEKMMGKLKKKYGFK